jgi:RNA polymerase sigma-70 factor (ECF subfamily)
MPRKNEELRTDDAAFEELFRELYRPVRSFFAKRGCGSEESEDLAQETFYRAYRSFGEFRGDAKPLTWLTTIAINVWSNHQRDAAAAKRAGHEVPLPEGRAELVDDDKPRDRAIDDERRRNLESAIEKLPKQMRRCVWLRVYQNRSFRDIADLLGVTEGTARSQMSLAKPKLRSILAEHYPDLDADLDDREE